MTALGVAAMLGGPLQAQRLGLGLRSQVALGTVLLAVPALLVLGARPGAARAALGKAAVPARTIQLSLLLGAALWVGSIGLMEMQSLVLPPSAETLTSSGGSTPPSRRRGLSTPWCR